MTKGQRLRLGMETFSYHLAFAAGRMSILDFIGRSADLGLEGVQLNMGQLGPFLKLHPGGARAIREMAAGLGMFLEVDTRGTDPEHLRTMLSLCSSIGADVLRTYPSCGGDLEQELLQAPAHLRAVLPSCQDLGIRIAVENHEYETAMDILKVVRETDSTWVGAHVDTGNSMMVWEEPVAAVRALAPVAVSSHVKDHVVILEEGVPRVVGVTLGSGSADCAECYRILAQDSPLERLVIEVCYGYSAPFRRTQEQGCGGVLGTGAFRLAEGALDPAWCMPYPGRASGKELDRLLAWQDASVVQSVAYVKALNGPLQQ